MIDAEVSAGIDAVIQIRAALPDDVETILSLDRAIRDVPHWALVDYLSTLEPTGPDLRTSGMSRCLFLAESGGEVVGFAVGGVTRAEDEAHAELETVGVATAARRVGVGRALCVAVIAWSRGQGATEMGLEVRSRSVGAIALYEGLGFAAEGRRAKYYREPDDDAVLMRLMLVKER